MQILLRSILIQEISILEKVYERVVLPSAVREELLHPAEDETVRDWIARPPAWIDVRTPQGKLVELTGKLDPGEQDAIALASELHAGRLVIDDRQGRLEATRRGIPAFGTLGVLRAAALAGLVDLRSAVNLLNSTNFYVAPEVLRLLLKDVE